MHTCPRTCGRARARVHARADMHTWPSAEARAHTHTHGRGGRTPSSDAGNGQRPVLSGAMWRGMGRGALISSSAREALEIVITPPDAGGAGAGRRGGGSRVGGGKTRRAPRGAGAGISESRAAGVSRHACRLGRRQLREPSESSAAASHRASWRGSAAAPPRVLPPLPASGPGATACCACGSRPRSATCRSRPSVRATAS